MSSAHDLVAAGALLWRPGPGGPEIGLVHRPRYDDWTFPKGKPHGQEPLAVTAIREIAEETGRRVRLGRRLPCTTYPVGSVLKTVHYWAARDLGGTFEANLEVDEMRWLEPQNAVSLLSYPHDRRLLEDIDLRNALDTRTVLVVRHGKAGKRQEWDGPDSERPLDRNGRRQAAGICRLLPCFGVARLHAAPLVRCRETFEAYAREIGIDIADEPLFSEEGYWPAAEAAVTRLQALAAESEVPVAVCSQGGVIPDLLQRLVGRAELPVAEFPSRKASIWVLSFGSAGSDGWVLTAADHYPDPFH